MKVLYTANTYRHLYLCHKPYIKWFHDKKFIVHTATNSNKKLENVDHNYNIPVERYPFKLNNIKAIFKLKKIIEKEKYDIIHTHTPMGAVVTRLASIKYRKKNDVKIIYTAHGFHFYKKCPIINWLIYYPVEKILSKYTDLIITMNEEDYKFAKKYFKTKIEHIPGIGFDEQKFSKKLSNIEQNKLKEKLNIDKNSYIISYVAEINKRKRQMYLLKTIKKMELTNELFLLIGDDQNSKNIKKYIKKHNLQKHVKIIGFQENIGDYLDISNLIISVSNQEGLPLNIMESMYKEKPIIVTNCRGNIDLIQNKINGIVVDIKNKKQLINSISILKNNNNYAQKLGEYNKKIINKYSIRNVLPIMENIYNREIKKIKRLNIKEIQNLQLNMLKKLASYCDKNKIKYYIGCGTLAGSILRKGFFPWDDDIDVLMPREDYEKFIKTFKKNNILLLDCSNKDYYYPYAKLIDSRTIGYECKNNIKNYGVYIDVFPIDGSPSKIYLQSLKILKFLMMTQWGCYLQKRNIIIKTIYNITSIFTRILPNNFFAKIINNICKKHDINNCKKSGIVCHYRYNSEIMDSDIFKESTKVIFEKYEFTTVKKYDKYLTNLYGDYQKEDDHSNHLHFRAYWK